MFAESNGDMLNMFASDDDDLKNVLDMQTPRFADGDVAPESNGSNDSSLHSAVPDPSGPAVPTAPAATSLQAIDAAWDNSLDFALQLEDPVLDARQILGDDLALPSAPWADTSTTHITMLPANETPRPQHRLDPVAP